MESVEEEQLIVKLALIPTIGKMNADEWGEWLVDNGIDTDDIPTDEEYDYIVLTRDESKKITLFFRADTFRGGIEAIDKTLHNGNAEMFLVLKEDVKNNEDPKELGYDPIEFQVTRGENYE